MDDCFAAGRDFLRAEARLLERRRYATEFEGAPPAGVVDALRGYRNDDGGFGHGLEPDNRCPASVPIAVEVAFQALDAAGVAAPDLLGPACDYLARTAGELGTGAAVPLALPVIESYPRAAHMTDWTYVPGVNPTAGLVGLLYRLGFDHPWRAAGERYCWAALDAGDLSDEVHGLSEVLVFLGSVPDRDRAEKHVPAIAERLLAQPMFHLDPEAPGYGLSPLFIAPAPDAPSRSLFTDEQIEAHLDHLMADQQPDGGWPITWDPPGAAARLEWRGMVTLSALRTLVAYGRITPVAADR